MNVGVVKGKPKAKSQAKAKSRADRELERALKKLAGGRVTEGTIEALMEAAALLALGGYFDDSLRILQRLASSPKSIVRLAFDDSDGAEFREPYYLLAAVAATPRLKKELALSERELTRHVANRRTQFASDRALCLADPGSRAWGTKQATKLVKAMAAHLAKGESSAALERGRTLVDCPVEHWTALQDHLLLTAQVAFDAGETEEAVQLMARAAEERQGESNARWDELDVLLSYEPSALALARGDLGGVKLAPELVEQLRPVTLQLFEKLGASAETRVEWPKLLKKLAGARALQPGASNADLDALEARLKTKLPEQYRALLKASNGVNQGKEALRLLPAAEVQWFKKSNAEWIAAYEEQGAAIEHWRDTLQISAVDDGEVYLLNPSIRTARGEWEAWHFANYHPGEHRYESLGQMLESLAEG